MSKCITFNTSFLTPPIGDHGTGSPTIVNPDFAGTSAFFKGPTFGTTFGGPATSADAFKVAFKAVLTADALSQEHMDYYYDENNPRTPPSQVEHYFIGDEPAVEQACSASGSESMT